MVDIFHVFYARDGCPSYPQETFRHRVWQVPRPPRNLWFFGNFQVLNPHHSKHPQKLRALGYFEHRYTSLVFTENASRPGRVLFLSPPRDVSANQASLYLIGSFLNTFLGFN